MRGGFPFRFSVLALALAMVMVLAVMAPAGPAHGDDDDPPPPPPKGPLAYPNLGSHLSGLAQAYEQGHASQGESAGQAAISQGGSVAVTIYLTANVSEVVQFLEDNGGDPRNVGEDYIEAYVPVSLLGAVSERPGVIRVREIIPPQPEFGPITSQGVAAHLASPWHTAGYSGQGVKVGIIDSFEGIRNLMGSELPTTVVARCYTSVGRYSSNLAACDSDSPHGTAVAEAVVDIAPEVSLYIANPISPADESATVRWMADQGVTVINRSASWTVFQGPGDGTSPVSNNVFESINHAANNGIIWVNSAGNYAEQNWWTGSPSADADGFIYFDGSSVLNYVDLVAGQQFSLVVRWDDNWPGASRDLDVCFFPLTNLLDDVCSDDFQDGSQGAYPIEFIGVDILSSGFFAIEITHHSGTLPSWIQLQVRGANLEHSTPRHSINNASESANPSMLAVGATHYWNTNVIADYSSQGPTPDNRIKPDIVGTACAQTASYDLRDPGFYGGNNCWFAGTSQAAPHVAGLAALVKQANPSFTPQQVAEYLKNNAAERGASGPDNTWGYGFAQLPTPPAEIVDPCASELTGDGPTNGAWAAGCQSAESGRGYARYYGFTTTEARDVTITLSSSVDPYLYLRSGDRTDSVSAQNDDHGTLLNTAACASPAGLGNTDSCITIPGLSAGTYTIEATTYATGTAGNFTLTVSGLGGTATGPGPGPDPGTDACAAVALTGDRTENGTWAADCQSEERSGSYARYFSFNLTEQVDVTFTVNSDVDSYMYLRAGNARSGATLNNHQEDDDAGGDRNAQVSESLAAGDYTLEVTTYNSNETGSFTLTVSGFSGGGTAPGPGPDPGADTCAAVALTGDRTENGTWAADCQSEERSGRYARYYSFTLEQQGDVTFTVNSDVDSYMYLRAGNARSGATLNNHQEDDDAGGDRNAQVSESLAAGDYTLEVTTYNSNEAGSFTLTISGFSGGGTAPGPGPDPGADTCAAVALTGDGTENGTWAADCQSQHTVTGQHPNIGYARYYSFELEQSSEVTIDLVSSVDTYLYLRRGDSRSGDFLRENDDVEPGVNLNSRISETLDTGSYTIEATTYSPGEAGSFTLTISGLGGG
jgi:hypothetical protein